MKGSRIFRSVVRRTNVEKIDRLERKLRSGGTKDLWSFAVVLLLLRRQASKCHFAVLLHPKHSVCLRKWLFTLVHSFSLSTQSELVTQMGNCFSDPSKPPGKGQTLGSAPSHPAQSSPTTTTQPTSAAGRPAKQRINSPPPQMLGSPGAGGDAGNPRDRALKAAEERAKAVNSSFNQVLLASGCKIGMEDEAD